MAEKKKGNFYDAVIDFISMDDRQFCKWLLADASEEEIEEYFQEFPEYRKYWDPEPRKNK